MSRILFVCLGNICRSPLAEGLFINKLSSRGLTHIYEVDSCGTGDWHIGERPDPRTLENAKSNGVHLPSRARQVTREDIKQFDFIVAMDRSNMERLHQLADEEDLEKIFLMRDHDELNRGSDVPDPYFGGINGFQEVFEILDRSTEAFLNYLESRASDQA
jgi:protein-tyrosine phosphatase